MKRITIILMLISIFKIIYALNGDDIINNANAYKNHSWYCNDWNARELLDSNGNVIKSNRDTDPNNNIIEYPFYSRGAKYYDENGNTVTATGYHTGVAYGWGLGDTIGNYNSKLTNRNPEF